MGRGRLGTSQEGTQLLLNQLCSECAIPLRAKKKKEAQSFPALKLRCVKSLLTTMKRDRRSAIQVDILPASHILTRECLALAWFTELHVARVCRLLSLQDTKATLDYPLSNKILGGGGLKSHIESGISDLGIVVTSPQLYMPDGIMLAVIEMYCQV